MEYEWLKYTDYVERDYYDGPLAMTFKIGGIPYYAKMVGDDSRYYRRYFAVEMSSEQVEVYHQYIRSNEYDAANRMFYREGQYCVFDFGIECVRMENLRMPIKEDVV